MYLRWVGFWLLALVLSCAAADRGKVVVLHTDSSRVSFDAGRADAMLHSAARWLRVGENDLPIIIVVYGCPSCLEELRGHDPRLIQPVLQIHEIPGRRTMFFLWYQDSPADVVLATGLTQALGRHLGLHLNEEQIARCATHVAIEVRSSISVRDLRR